MGAWLLPAISPHDWERACETASRDPRIHLALGIHPHIAAEMPEAALERALGRLPALLRGQGAVAVGEIGLDFYRHKEPAQKQGQRRAFARQLEIAADLGLPALIHNVQAHGATLEALQRRRLADAPGVLHAYGASPQMVPAFVKQGMYLGFGGAVTWEEARRAPASCAQTPADRLLLETDAPWQAPQSVRGQDNAPWRLREVLEEVARLRGASTQEVARQSWENALRLLGISAPSAAP